MRTFAEVEKLLTELSIPYKIVEHPASHSTEESDNYIKDYEGCRSKTLILANKKSTQFYMIIMDDAKQVDMNRLSEILEVKRLHFISEDRLEEMLGLNSGIVSLFGLVGTNYENMNIYFDQQMLDDYQIQTFHPNDNTASVVFSPSGIEKIMKQYNKQYIFLEVEE